jgi:hypothetical protein
MTLLASLVLEYVDDVRDRLALECVCSAWRAAGAAPLSWAPRDTLVVPSPLASKLTDAGLLALLARAGPDLRSLVVSDAGAGFTGQALVDFVKGDEGGVGAGAGEVSSSSSSSSPLLQSLSLSSSPPLRSSRPAFWQLQSLVLRRCPGVLWEAGPSCTSTRFSFVSAQLKSLFRP